MLDIIEKSKSWEKLAAVPTAEKQTALGSKIFHWKNQSKNVIFSGKKVLHFKIIVYAFLIYILNKYFAILKQLRTFQKACSVTLYKKCGRKELEEVK